jgi:diaminohydroxyphosphoribosylaminopyrimidine deaminase / 5-amino-6-(5-phosphoribosylamino)uracil reductase
MSSDIQFMQRCLQLASLGLGFTAPNPMVGCVIVHEGKIIGEGYHRQYGSHHAEVNAINDIKDTELLKKSSLYVNLEPCSHFGKTPPCADLIVKMGIPEVIIGIKDPFAEVAGKGIQKLKNAGVKVRINVLEQECRDLNKRFLTFHEKKRPYIILKWAKTLDGFIGFKSEDYAKGRPAWITDEKLKTLVHKWRTEEQAIMVGTTTAELDNPQLNAREWEGKNPLRIVIDQHLRLPRNLHLFDESIPSIVFTRQNNVKNSSHNLEFITIDFNKDIIKQICEVLFIKNIQSVIIEGGTQLLNTFINSGTWDEARIFTGNKEFKNGVKSPEISGDTISSTMINKDHLLILKNPLQKL